MKPEKILITGAAGFTGRHACQYFSDRGFQVIPVVRTMTGSGFESHYNVIKCELTSKNQVMDLIYSNQPDYVLHLAGQNSVDKSWKEPLITFESNVMSTLYLLESIRTLGKNIKVVIAGSALEIDSSKTKSPPHPYSLSKTIQTLLSCSLADLFAMDIVIVNPTNLIGSGQSNGICSIIARQISAMINGVQEKILTINDLSARRDFLDVRDALKAYHILFEKGKAGEKYNIATGVTHSLEEVIVEFSKIAGIQITMQAISRAGNCTDLNLDIAKMKQLGWLPSIPFNESLKDILTFHLEHYQ
ncbi:NAD-dependent epimerase/dehydratase family protein [Bacillus sp. EB600]|uniref:NAD-dependent epimerase/dehydratase family protein n=1 Tax=Bacillus sp. EB600 TaxID=2806345 RepID=UPI00210F208C|nr:NAD-dependent epimerase/dehydratase family protein [Bacillus sp. EB600]MCQ6282356.1 NAD-dependent epimerase/dehydratase family protein [Bacillus sp. EB600]